MNLEQVTVGSLLEIYIRRDGFNYKVVSKIELVDGDVIAVTPIASKNRMFRFQKTDMVDVVFHDGDRTLKWTNVKPEIVVDEEGNKLHGFIISGEAESFNRRLTYRLNVERNMTMRYLVHEEDYYGNEGELSAKDERDVVDEAMSILGGERFKWIECTCFIKDLSEGGASIYSDVILKKGDEICFDFPSPEGQIVCKAVVVRARQDSHGYYDNAYGCCFTETSRNFTKFLFAQQRRNLQRKSGLKNED